SLYYIMLLDSDIFSFIFFFFFSSRRRHTRCLSDWSSDVCSSDLTLPALSTATPPGPLNRAALLVPSALPGLPASPASVVTIPSRSEERRVGKECTSRRSPDH